MRIAKYIANAGYCSRRDAEKLILNKKVKINNILCVHPSEKVTKIAIETSSELIRELIGEEVNNSSISAIVEDQSKKIKDEHYGI